MKTFYSIYSKIKLQFDYRVSDLTGFKSLKHFRHSIQLKTFFSKSNKIDDKKVEILK